jgi:hypothetical protein
MDKPNTLQEAVLLIESLNKKNADLQSQFDSESASNVQLRTELSESKNEIFGLKTALESEAATAKILNAKIADLEASNKKLSEDISALQGKFDELSQKDMDVDARASEKAAQIAGSSGIEHPIESANTEEELSMEEISEKISKASGKEKALLMNKYGEKISQYLKRKKF